MPCPDPGKDCPLCPRLVDFRLKNRAKFPGEWNAPVPSFGPENGRLLIVGLAPGLKGANFTGRPFTADYAGDLLYATLLKFGFAEGVYKERADDGLKLKNCRITNAVRCVPPENKPTPEEMRQCLGFLQMEMAALKNTKVILSLGLVSHNSVLKALNHKISKYKFTHGAVHDLGKVKLIDSYHCSRYNTNTGRLTTRMFEDIFKKITGLLRQPAG
ncbi:MAG: uracil-DNA glycosylase [Alphaproteobacteria bacterium PRO2]|nr:uracil-DNA glycosylase [Alphaproteobacteria bacterium PRO2]